MKYLTRLLLFKEVRLGRLDGASIFIRYTK
jgi:hypothetical protein